VSETEEYPNTGTPVDAQSGFGTRRRRKRRREAKSNLRRFVRGLPDNRPRCLLARSPRGTRTQRPPPGTNGHGARRIPDGGQRIGYARVSTRQQDLALQLADLRRAGCARTFRDVGSGTIRRRPQLDACLDYLRPGDTLVVWRLDRLGRSLHHLVDVIAQLEQRDIAFLSLREAIDTTTAAGKLQLQLFAALAEFERELIRERSQAGREIAKVAGRLGGRPRKLTADKAAAALAIRDGGDMTMTQIARALGVGRTTLYDHLDLPRLDGIPPEPPTIP
jgi:DNA invertase Pin-like site-specific DNA recombinase